MYEYIKGTIIEKDPTHAVIENNNIGYDIQITLHTYSGLQNKDEIKLYTFLYVREDIRTLYGFINPEERTAFELFIGVSGIGPNTARLILSAMTPAQVVEAVESNDEIAFKSVKGIGAKTAQRILLDLRDKISKIRGELPSPSGLSPAATAARSDMEEARQALLKLGFPAPKVMHALNKINKSGGGDTVENTIKEALKLMS